VFILFCGSLIGLTGFQCRLAAFSVACRLLASPGGFQCRLSALSVACRLSVSPVGFQCRLSAFSVACRLLASPSGFKRATFRCACAALAAMSALGSARVFARLIRSFALLNGFSAAFYSVGHSILYLLVKKGMTLICDDYCGSFWRSS
jgi:hypothetical protein